MGRISDIGSRFPLLPDYLRRWCQGDTSSVVVRYLLLVAATVAKRNCRRRLSAAWKQEEVSIDEMAKSVASVVFLKSGPRSPLCGALLTVIDDDARLIARFVSYATVAINNELFARWQTTDPAGYKLWECLKDALKSENYDCWPKPTPIWVRLAHVQDLNVDGLPWRESELTQVVCDCTNSADPDMPQWLNSIMIALSEVGGKQRFVEIEALYDAMWIEVRQLFQTASNGDTQISFLDPATRQRLGSQIDITCNLAHEYLDRYRKRGECKEPGEPEMKFLHEALDAFVEDIKAHGQDRQSRFKYVKEQCPELTDEYYERHLKSAFQGAITYFWQQLKSSL